MMARIVAIAVVLAAVAMGSAVWAQNTDAKPAGGQAMATAEVPWGKEVDGMVARLIAPKEVALNEPLVLTMEVKNVSNRTRYLVNMAKFIQGGHYMNNECAELSYTGPDGKESRPGVHAGYGIVPADFKPIAPGEVARSSIKMLANMTYPGLVSPAGRWMLKLSLTSPKPARAVVANVGKVVGNTMVAEPVYGEPTKDQVDHAWVKTITVEAAVRIKGEPPKLIVHEWGVFCTFADAKYANANMKQEWASMPPEFYRQFPDRKLRKVEEWDPMAPVDKPIIYFYTDRQNLDVDVKVKFADGAPVVWWPCTAEPLDDFRVKAPGICRELHWSGKLKADGTEEVGAGFRICDYTVKTPQDSWVNQARLDNAAWFVTDDATVRVSPVNPRPADRLGMRAGRNGRMFSFRNQSERFIYYDGLTPAVSYLSCQDMGERGLKLTNSAKLKIGDVILVDRRDQKHAAMEHFSIEAGGSVTAAAKAQDQDKAAQWLLADLRAAGLYEKEANSVLAIWRQGLFDRPGVTAIYLLPRDEYDRMLPLIVNPKPQKVVRVGIVVQGNLEFSAAAMEAKVASLVRKMDDDDYRVRDKAAADLARLGESAMGAIRKAMAGKCSAEVKTRLQKVLEKDGASYLEK